MEDEENISPDPIDYANFIESEEEVVENGEDEVINYADFIEDEEEEVEETEEEVVEEESAFIPGSFVLNHENRALQKETQEALEEEDEIVDTSENISFEEFDNVSEEELVPMLRVKYDNIKTEDGSTRFEFNEDQARLDQVQVYDNVTKEYTYLPLNTDYNRTKYSNNYGKSVDQDKVDAKHAKAGRKSYNTLIDLVNVDSQPGKDKKVVTKKEVDEEGNIVDVEKDRRFTSDSGMVNPIKVKTTNRNGEEVEVEAKGYLIEKAKKELFSGKYETLEEAVQAIVQEDEYIQGALRFQANLMGLENDESQKISNTIDAIVEDEEVVVNPFDGLLLKSIGEATGGMVDASEAQFQEQFIKSGMINDMYAKDDLIDNYYRLGLPTYAGEEQYQLAKKAFDELEFGDTPKTEYEIDQIRTLYASLASERMESLKEDLRTWFSNDPVGLEVFSKIEEREVKKIDAEEYNISYKKAAVELGPEASTDAVADLASYNIEQAQNAKNVDILIDNAYNEGIPEEDRKKLAELGTSFQSRSEELANNRQASFIESLKEGKTKEEAEAIAKEKFPKTKEDEILENRYVSTVSNLLDNGEFDIYKDIEGNTPNVHYSEGDAAIRSESNYMKNKVDEYKFVSQDFLNRRIHSNNSELIYLAKQLNNRQAEWLFEGSSAQKFYNIVGDAVGSDQALSADIARMQEIANTGELPLKLTTIPNSESPLVKAWNNAVEDRTVLGLAKVLNVDMTSTERDGFRGAAYYSFAPAFDMENISPNEARRRMYEEMQAEGIELTDKEKFQMNEAIDSWERSGGQVGDLSRMGLEMAATFLLTGGAGNVANMSRFIMGKAFGGAVKLGMNPTVASSLTRYTAGVGAEFYALEGASLMDEQVFDKEAMGAGHNLRLAMTLGAGRAGVTKIGDKMNKAIYNTAKTQYRNGSKGLFKTLKWMNKTPGIETTTGLFKFGVAQPMTAASLLQAEGAIENIIAGKSMASIFHELTDGEALMETYGAMLAMQLSHPSQGINKSVETFKREVDRINGDNPAWNSAYREIGLKKVKGDEYHVDADVDKAVRAKIKEIKNDPSIPTADKPNQVRYYYRLGNKLKTKKSFTELSKSWQPENVKEQVAISVYDKSYKDLDLKQKKYIDNNYKNDPLFEVGERLQSSIKSLEKGNELDGIDFLNFADAGATNGNLVPKYEMMLLGYSEKQAQSVTDLSNKVVNRARDKFSNNNKRLSSAEGMAFMNNYSQVLVMNGEIFNIQKQINEKKLTGSDKVDAEKQIEFIEKQRDVIEGLNEKLSLQEYERALKEEAPRTIEMAKEAGLEVFEGNQSEINKFQEQFPEGTFVGTESGLFGVDTRIRIIDPETGSSTIPNPNKGKSIAIFNKDTAREVRETGVEAHEILGHGTQEAMVGEAAINKRASEISAEQPNISSEKAKEIATQEKLDYIDNVKSELKRRGTGAYEKVEAEMEKVKAYREYKENVKNNGARDINIEKEFLAEFVQLAEQKAFEGVKGTEREIKEVTSLELSSNPKEYVDFVLRGGTRSSKVKSEVLKESIDKLNKLNKEYGTDVSLSKSNKAADKEFNLESNSPRQNKRNETIDRIEKEHATSKEAWDKWTSENPGEVLKMAYSFVPDLININKRRGVENPEDTASETAMTELFNTIKAFDPSVKKTEGSFSLAGYIGQKLNWRAGDNIKRTEKKTKTISENQEGVKTIMERQVDRSTSTPESTDKAATKGIDPRRVMDSKTVEKYNTSVKNQLLKDIVKVDKATGEKTIDLEKLDKLDYADNKIMSPKEAAEFFGISESTLAGKNPLDSKNTTKGDIKIKDGMRSEQGSEAYNLNKKLYDISEEYSRLLNTTQLQPKDIVAGDIAELEAKYKKSGSERDRKALQKRKDMMRAQDGQRTGDQSKQGTSLNIDPSIVKKLYEKTDIRSMGKGSQPYVQTAKNFDAKTFREKAGIVNPKDFKGKNEAKTKKEKDALRNQSTLNTALARNYIRMVEGKIQREALEELKQEVGDKEMEQNLDKAIRELYKGSSKFSASLKQVIDLKSTNEKIKISDTRIKDLKLDKKELKAANLILGLDKESIKTLKKESEINLQDKKVLETIEKSDKKANEILVDEIVKLNPDLNKSELLKENEIAGSKWAKWFKSKGLNNIPLTSKLLGDNAVRYKEFASEFLNNIEKKLGSLENLSPEIVASIKDALGFGSALTNVMRTDSAGNRVPSVLAKGHQATRAEIESLGIKYRKDGNYRLGDKQKIGRLLKDDIAVNRFLDRTPSNNKTTETYNKVKHAFQPKWDYSKSGIKNIGEKLAEKLEKDPNYTEEQFDIDMREALTHPELRGTKDGYEKTMEANAELLNLAYDSLADVYFKSKDKNKALEDIANFLQMQTNAATGIFKGMAGMESATTKPTLDSKTGKTHNEHQTDLLAANQKFISLLEKYNGKNKTGFKEQLKQLTSDFKQALISRSTQKFKDDPKRGGAGKMSSENYLANTFADGTAINQRILGGANRGKTNLELLQKQYGNKRILEALKQIPENKRTVEIIEAIQKIEYAKEQAQVKKQNIEVVEEAKMSASNKSPEKIREELRKRDKAIRLANKINKPIKKARVFDFDDTIARTKSKVFATKEGKRKVLTAEEFAKQGEKLKSEGWDMDFSDFNKVVDGKKGPLFDVMKKMKEAAGKRDMFVLTARSQESAKAIHEFLKEMGLDIPIENIKGLGDSSPFAKSDWVVEKASEGYNDFYFADDHTANVKAVRDALEVIDVKSQTQIARMNASNKMNERFNEILENSTGIGKEKIFSDIKAEIRGDKARRQRFFIPPSAEDFTGLLYRTLGKGKKGEAAMEFYKENLLDPYTRAQANLSKDRVNLMSDFKELKKQLDVPKELKKKTDSGFTNEQAVRVFLWSKTGKEIPGISKTDFKELNDIVENNPKLKAFAEQILTLTKGDGYSTPSSSWNAGTITTDLISLLNKTKRAKYLEQWKENKNVIFSKENLNKLEAAFGKKYREALENSLNRMESGSNRTNGGNRLSNRVLDYVNNSTGVVMFLNARSAVLQTISAANFTNWTFNNPLKMGKAFANQPQYWKDFTMLMNSDYLVDRRNGLKLNISESEIADAAASGTNKAKAAVSYIIEKGYLPTKFADSFAIASGGAMFYRNRVNDLVKNGMSEVDAKKKAMEEFIEASEKAQQSSDPSKISSQQASDLGRVVLSFANTPMQYARIQKRAIQDIANGRGSNRENLSKIAYYGFLQNVIFNSLQQGLFAMGFGDGDIGEEEEKKITNTINGMVDSQLRGLGMAGVTLQVLKNLGIDIYNRSKRDRPEYGDAWIKLLEFSPAIKSKLSRFRGAAYPFDSKKRRAEVFEKGFSLDNPAYESVAKVISGVTNVPLDRLYSKVTNLKAAMQEDTETWKSVAMVLGWPEWQLRTEADVKQGYRDDPSKFGAWEQKSILSQFGYTDDEIKKLKNSDMRVKEIKKIQEEKDKQYFPKDEDKKIYYKGKSTDKDQALDSPAKLKSMIKATQIRHLKNYGLSSQEIKSLKYEADRVAKLLELAKQPGQVDSLAGDIDFADQF